MLTLEVRVKEGTRWVGGSVARLCMSVGAPVFEGHSLATLISWIIEHFERCEIVLADTLQRHNLILSPKEAEALTRYAGNSWLMRHEEALKPFGSKVKITRWDDWRLNSEFSQKLKQLERLYVQNPPFSDAVKCDVEEYTRRINKHQRTNYLTASGQVQYILEELAIVALHEEQIPSVEVYPGSQPRSCKLLCKMDALPTELACLSQMRFVGVRVVPMTQLHTLGNTTSSSGQRYLC